MQTSLSLLKLKEYNGKNLERLIKRVIIHRLFLSL